jgi:hypothetical protein
MIKGTHLTMELLRDRAPEDIVAKSKADAAWRKMSVGRAQPQQPQPAQQQQQQLVAPAAAKNSPTTSRGSTTDAQLYVVPEVDEPGESIVTEDVFADLDDSAVTQPQAAAASASAAGSDDDDGSALKRGDVLIAEHDFVPAPSDDDVAEHYKLQIAIAKGDVLEMIDPLDDVSSNGWSRVAVLSGPNGGTEARVAIAITATTCYCQHHHCYHHHHIPPLPPPPPPHSPPPPPPPPPPTAPPAGATASLLPFNRATMQSSRKPLPCPFRSHGVPIVQLIAPCADLHPSIDFLLRNPRRVRFQLRTFAERQRQKQPLLPQSFNATKLAPFSGGSAQRRPQRRSSRSQLDNTRASWVSSAPSTRQARRQRPQRARSRTALREKRIRTLLG